MSNAEPAAAPVDTTDADALALMRLVHLIEAVHHDRATSQLDLRQRLVIQGLGLWGPTTIAALGQRLGVSPSTMTGLGDRLEGGGYVERCDHPSDRRATLLALTRKGKRAFEGEKDFYRRLLGQALASLGAPERRLILRALAEVPPSGLTARSPRTRRSGSA
jgi:DNA-binding MarR family transcriptional regulator